MAGNYTAIPMLDVFETLGRANLGEEFSEFQNAEKGTLEALRLFSDNSPLCYPSNLMRQAFDRKTSPEQKVYVDVNQIRNPGTGTQSRRIGTGGNDRVTVEIVAQTPIEEGFQISRVNEAMGRFSSYSIETRAKMTMAFLTGEAMTNIMVRANAQAVGYLDTNKWAAGGAGTIFSAAGDFKSVPAGDDELFFWKMNTEARENKFKRSRSGFDVIGSDYLEFMVGYVSGFGGNNFSDLRESMANMRFYIESELEPPSPETQQAVLYAVARGGVGMIAHAHKFTDSGMMADVGNDYWFTAAMPALPMFDGINTDLIEIQGKGFRGWADNFATYDNDPSRIDLIEAMSYVATFYFFRADSPTARRPIVGYIKLK